MTAPLPLVRDVRARVGDALTTRVEADAAAQRARLDAEDERQLARRLIGDALTEERRRRLHANEELLTDAVEEQIAQAVLDLLFGLGRLQRLLADPDVT